MKLLKWVPLFLSMMVLGQESDTLPDLFFGDDSLIYKNNQNSFSDVDESILLGYDLLRSSHQTNFGAPIIEWAWQPNQTMDISVGDRVLNFGVPTQLDDIWFHQKYPHTKIIYSQTYEEGQRLNFLHKRRYQYGAFVLDYDRLVSQGFMWNEKNKFTKFKFRADFRHPEIPYQSKVQFHTFKNQSQWNGGVGDDSLFLSGAQSNWELLPVNWSNLETSIKHIGLDWRHIYSISDASQFVYEVSLSQDSLFYEGLQDDTLFYPVRLDSATSYTRSFVNSTHNLYWNQKVDDNKDFQLGIRQQTFKSQSSSIPKWTGFVSIESWKYKNKLYFELGKEQFNTHTLRGVYTQKLNFKGITNNIKIAYDRKLPNWMQRNGTLLNQQPFITCIIVNDKPIIDKYIEWKAVVNKNLIWTTSYHDIDGYTYFNEQAMVSQLDESVQVFQTELFHHLNRSSFHWVGNAIYQCSSNDNLPMANVLLNQKAYWQGKLFKEATETQIGLRGLYRSSHPGMIYSPIVGDFLVNSGNQTNASLRLDCFANFQIQTLKVYAAYENLNALWQEAQYVLYPYAMAKPTFRLSLIWNFYD